MRPGEQERHWVTAYTTLDGYVVPVDKSQLEKAPRYSPSETPEYSDEYGQKVYDNYGVGWM